MWDRDQDWDRDQPCTARLKPSTPRRFWNSGDCQKNMMICLAVLTEYCDVRHRGRWRDIRTTCINSDRVDCCWDVNKTTRQRQSARMSEITNDGLTRSGTVCFTAVPIWQQLASKGGHLSGWLFLYTVFVTVLRSRITWLNWWISYCKDTGGRREWCVVFYWKYWAAGPSTNSTVHFMSLWFITTWCWRAVT